MGVMSRRVIVVKAAKILGKDDNCNGRLTYLLSSIVTYSYLIVQMELLLTIFLKNRCCSL